MKDLYISEIHFTLMQKRWSNGVQIEFQPHQTIWLWVEIVESLL